MSSTTSCGSAKNRKVRAALCAVDVDCVAPGTRVCVSKAQCSLTPFSLRHSHSHADIREAYNDTNAERGRREANERNSIAPDTTFKVRSVISMPTPAGVCEIEYFKEAAGGFESFGDDEDETETEASGADGGGGGGSRNGVQMASAQESERALSKGAGLLQVMESMEA